MAVNGIRSKQCIVIFIHWIIRQYSETNYWDTYITVLPYRYYAEWKRADTKEYCFIKKKKVLFHICEVLKQKSAVVKKVIKVVIFGETWLSGAVWELSGVNKYSLSRQGFMYGWIFQMSVHCTFKRYSFSLCKFYLSKREGQTNIEL